jgi:hypothetical protein
VEGKKVRKKSIRKLCVTLTVKSLIALSIAIPPPLFSVISLTILLLFFDLHEKGGYYGRTRTTFLQ